MESPPTPLFETRIRKMRKASNRLACLAFASLGILALLVVQDLYIQICAMPSEDEIRAEIEATRRLTARLVDDPPPSSCEALRTFSHKSTSSRSCASFPEEPTSTLTGTAGHRNEVRINPPPLF